MGIHPPELYIETGLPMDQSKLSDKAPRRRKSTRFGLRFRNYFLTGLVVAAPIGITVFLTWSFVASVDRWVKPLIPRAYNPDNYLPFSVPGVGLLFSILMLALLGFLTANLVGKTIVSYGEVLLDRMPLVRNIYRALKQIFETAISESNRSFKQVGLIEYPRRGLWAVVFVATQAKGEVSHKLPSDEDEVVSVFLPTTPNPTSGFLLFVPRSEITILDMSVEEAAKLVISAGLVTPEYKAKTEALAEKSGAKKELESQQAAE